LFKILGFKDADIQGPVSSHIYDVSFKQINDKSVTIKYFILPFILVPFDSINDDEHGMLFQTV
jgi:hypothetical protein